MRAYNQKRAKVPIELELGQFSGSSVSAGNQTEVLCKSGACSLATEPSFWSMINLTARSYVKVTKDMRDAVNH